jgi:hypothetical protein
VGGGQEGAGDEDSGEVEPRARETWGVGSHVRAAWRERAGLGKRAMRDAKNYGGDSRVRRRSWRMVHWRRRGPSVNRTENS